MNFLCRNHQQMVLSNIELARKLWLGAYQNGVKSFQLKEWRSAISFFGTAYEIGVLRLQLERHSSAPSFTVTQAVSSGRCLICVLSELEENFSTETYLAEIFGMLSELCLDKDASQLQRSEAFTHLGEFRNRLVKQLKKSGKAKTALKINADYVLANGSREAFGYC